MLTGQTVLIVETQFLIALDIQRILESLGATQTLFARNAADALDAAAHWPECNMALVEIRPERDDDIALAQGLHRTGVKLVLMTADAILRRHAPGFPAAPLLMKPFSEDDLASAIKQALAG